MATNHKTKIMRAVWDGILKRREITKKLATSLCNFENMLLVKSKIEAMLTLVSYSRSKKYASRILKNKAVLDVLSILTQRHTEILKRYFGRYRAKAKEKHIRRSKCKVALLKIENANTRWTFRKWATVTDQIVAAQELNETGPVTEQVFEANRAIKNMIAFMNSENFTPEEIHAWVTGVN